MGCCERPWLASKEEFGKKIGERLCPKRGKAFLRGMERQICPVSICPVSICPVSICPVSICVERHNPNADQLMTVDEMQIVPSPNRSHAVLKLRIWSHTSHSKLTAHCVWAYEFSFCQPISFKSSAFSGWTYPCNVLIAKFSANWFSEFARNSPHFLTFAGFLFTLQFLLRKLMFNSCSQSWILFALISNLEVYESK